MRTLKVTFGYFITPLYRRGARGVQHTSMRTLVIDNYDSLTFNLAHLLAVVNQEEAVVVLNDRASLDELRQMQFDNVLISPGPGRPDRASDTGMSRDIINCWDKPLLDVCLGHQIIAAVHGGTVVRDPHPVHGRAVPLRHARDSLFAGVPSSFRGPLQLARGPRSASP